MFPSQRSRIAPQRMRRSTLQLPEDRIANHLLVPAQARIPEAKLLDSDRRQKLCPLFITRPPAGMPMTTAVHFDGQRCFMAIEVDHIIAERKLTAKLVSAESAIAQPTPHQLFGPGWFPA